MIKENKTSQEIAEIFSKIARRYDLLNRVLSFGSDRHWRKVAVKLAKLPEKGTVLDVCSGTADLAIELCRQWDNDIHVKAVDFSREMLIIGEAKAKKLELKDRISFQLADAEDLPFEDDSFDAVTIAFGLRNIIDRAKAMREFFRVAKPGGRFVCLEFTLPRSAVFRPFYFFYLKLIPLIAWSIGADPNPYRYLGDSIKAFPSPSKLAELISKAGWQAVDYRTLTFGVVAIHSAIKSVDRGSRLTTNSQQTTAIRNR